MATYIRTQLVDADPVFLVTDPDGDLYLACPDEPIPAGSDLQKGIVVKTGFGDENGEHLRWIPDTQLRDSGYILLQHNPNLATDKPSVSSEMVDRAIISTETKTLGDKTTIVRATLWNGFELVEASSCVSPENYNEYIGESICLGKIRDKVWMLLGFLLQTAVSCAKVDA